MPLQATYKKFLQDQVLHVQTCTACSSVHMYPRVRCPSCHSKELEWLRVAGTGKLLTFTIVRATAPSAFQDDVPYGIGIVRLDEGPQLMVRLHPGDAGDFSDYVCDMPVSFQPASSEEIEDRPVAWFGPA